MKDRKESVFLRTAKDWKLGRSKKEEPQDSVDKDAA